MAEPVIIVDYDPNWVITFRKLRSQIEESVEGLPVKIEHVGSTAILGAAAKPIIDIDLVLPSADTIPRAIQSLERAGYHHLGDLGISGREAFESSAFPPAHHLYLVVLGNSEHMRHLRFRDYLRSHPEKTEQYSTLKKSLAKKFRNDREAYTNAKSDFVEAVLRASETP
jgi:GrpB-like predicted nucleotidyltransferase (UPF0157 family)